MQSTPGAASSSKGVSTGPVHPEWPARLHVVTGKGGTGKTTVAAALALALAADGHRTLLAEVEGRQGIAQLFGTDALPQQTRSGSQASPEQEPLIAKTASGGQVRALAVDPERALLEYLDRFYKLGAAGRALRRLGAIDFATTIAPGMRDVLLTGKVKEATTRTEAGHRVYQAVVLDAPPTGRVGRFLNVTAETARLAKVGPIKTQSEGVAALLRSPMTSVHVVTLLEEMPVQETADTIAELTDLRLPIGKIIINAARPPLLTTDSAPASMSQLRDGLAAAGLPTDPATVAGLAAETTAYLARERLEERLRAELTELGHPTVELPLLADGANRAGLDTLAGVLGSANSDA